MPVIEIIKSLFEGFGVSLEIFALTLLLAIPLGLVISFGSMSKFPPLKYISKFVVWVIRGTPLMLQLIIIFYGPGLLSTWANDLNVVKQMVLQILIRLLKM